MTRPSSHETRIGDAEREQAVSQLGDHYVAGRLTQEEYDERAAAAWSARTLSHLQPLFRDLPPAQRQEARQTARMRPRWRLPALPLVVAAVVLVVLLGAPWWAWLVLAWLWLSGTFAGRCSRGHLRNAPSR